MGVKYEVKCGQLPRFSWSRDSAVEAEELRGQFDSICPGPHHVDAIFTEDKVPGTIDNDARLAEAEEADERAFDRRVDSEMDLAREDEMADHYANVGRTPEEEGR